MASYGVEEIIEAIDSMCAFRTSMWEKTRLFEHRFADYCGTLSSVMVNSGLSADMIASSALYDIMKERVDRPVALVPTVTWPTHIWGLHQAGFDVRVLDVSPDTLNVDLDALRHSVGDKPHLISLVHLLGNPVDMDAVQDICKASGSLLMEDCCEALGSKFDGRPVGSFGYLSSYSFFFSHHMTTMEGGAVGINDPTLDGPLRRLRAHGWTRSIGTGGAVSGIGNRYVFDAVGYNFRPTEIQAGFGLRQLDRIEGFTETRKLHAGRIFDAVNSMSVFRPIAVHQNSDPVWMAIPLMIRPGAIERDRLQMELEARGVETRPVVAGNMARQPVAAQFPEYFDGDFPGADDIHVNGLYVGLSPMLSDEMVSRFINVLAESVHACQESNG